MVIEINALYSLLRQDKEVSIYYFKENRAVTIIMIEMLVDDKVDILEVNIRILDPFEDEISKRDLGIVLVNENIEVVRCHYYEVAEVLDHMGSRVKKSKLLKKNEIFVVALNIEVQGTSNHFMEVCNKE